MSHAPAPNPAKRCPNCGAIVVGVKTYCAPACQQAFHNRMAKRGKVALPLALGWRARRGSGDTAKAAFKELCTYLDFCNAEDHREGRPPMVDYLERSLKLTGSFGWRERATPRPSA